MEIVINNTIFVVRFESDRNCRSNLDCLESESLTIQFRNPYRQSLVLTVQQLKQFIDCNQIVLIST